MTHARDIMEPARVVPSDLALTTLARDLLDRSADAVCVVDGDELVGVLTGMDLVYREKRVHPPFTLTVFDFVIQLGQRRTEREIEKMAALKVSELMTREVVTVGPQASLEEVATIMVEQRLSIVPVVDRGRLLGVVTRRGMVEVALKHILAGG